MSAIPDAIGVGPDAGVDTGRGPPIAIPLWHVLVGLGFLTAGVTTGLVRSAGLAPATWRLATVHLLLAGWVCCTILGAATQFVPVWSGVRLASRRLAVVQLPLAAAGVAGLAAGFATGSTGWLAPAGTLLAAGLWTFVCNVGATLARARPLDRTERHFAYALVAAATVPVFGLALAVGYVRPGLVPVPRTGVVLAHATLALYGFVLLTVVGALYQLVGMFAGVDPDALDRRLRRVEEATLPVGVATLAAGRLVGVVLPARVGGLLVLAGLAAALASVGRTLLRATVDPDPTLRRYLVAVVAGGAWVVATVPAWLADPLDRAALYGAPAVRPLLLAGFVGLVVVGSLYHVVPFLLWLERYADRIGLEQVPGVEDLYSGRVARADLAATTAGVVALTAAGAAPVPGSVRLAGAVALGAGLIAAGGNLVRVVLVHAPGSPRAFLLGRVGTE